MKANLLLAIFLFVPLFVFSENSLCPDPPENDDPCISSINPPMDLTGGGSHTGTTCCARGFDDLNEDGLPADLQNVDCSLAMDYATVWYMYTPNPEDDGYLILLETGGDDPSEGPIAIEIYHGLPDQGCIGGGFGETLASSCGPFGVSFSIGNCIPLDHVFFVKVSTNDLDENCGEFVLTIIPESCGPMADSCIELAEHEPIKPVTPPNFEVDYVCIQGCLDYACPAEDAMGGCQEFTESPTVWFQVEVDELASQMFTYIIPNGSWDAIWSVYSGPDCDNLTHIDFGGTPPCSYGDATPDLMQNSVFDIEDLYWIMVTVDPGSVPSTGMGDGSFDLCVATLNHEIMCLGEEGNCDDESFSMEVVAREMEGEPLEGPYCPGEEVTIEVNFFYDASESGADWLAGFVPQFGDGWDMSNFDYAGNAPKANGSSAQYYEDGENLAPIIQENTAILCTYEDEFGDLQLCNLLCSSCKECDQKFLLAGSPIPSGYFWVNEGSNPGCENDGSPGEGWGVGSIQAQVTWFLTLKVKDLDAGEECPTNTDLSISIQTFSHGVIGCWEDPVGECFLDRMMFSPEWEVNCGSAPPSLIVENDEICSAGEVDVQIVNVGSPSITIFVEPIENPFVSGATVQQYPGSGSINDVLINISGEDQIQVYMVYSTDPDLTCPSNTQYVEVLVKTSNIVDFEPQICSCINGCTMIGVDPIQGSTYLWSTGESTSMINVCPTEPTSYSLTTTDSDGCIQEADVIVDCDGLIEGCNETVYGKLVYDVFIDENENGVKDPAEESYAGGSITIHPQNATIFNTVAGLDTILLPKWDFVVIYNHDNFDDWVLTTPSQVDIMFDDSQDCVLVEFGIKEKEEIRTFRLTHYLVPRCNSEERFRVRAKNTGTEIESGTIWLELDLNVSLTNVPENASIDTFISPNTVGWYFSDLVPGTSAKREVRLDIPGPPDFPVGGVLNHVLSGELNNENGSTIISDQKSIMDIVQCSFDPNDKAVEPRHDEGYTNIEQDYLTYKIRFQNTGNAPAFDIEIRDTLSEYLDETSVEYLGGSHDEFLTFSRLEDRILVFDFENIYLPDSTSDVEGSQGFVMFRVRINDGVEEGISIENTSHIYFDENPPIVTNTTQNVLYPDVDEDGYFSIEDCNDEDLSINPGAEEIANNDVDENCDGEILEIDNDMDGFNSDEDCDDENADINPDAQEIPNNDVDENCDGEILVIDNDMDGFNSDEDCDDENADINPDAEEIANNDIDENCDNVILYIDNDFDGYNSDEDCDDNNPDINPGAEEIPNNDVDENCDSIILIIDVDMDGFNSDEDCDDMNADIYPGAEDIPGNGIDEDCDGEDAVIIDVGEVDDTVITIYPNPSHGVFTISTVNNFKSNYIVVDILGEIVKRGQIKGTTSDINLESLTDGLYLLILKTDNREDKMYFKLLKI